jgi:dynein heavy chain
MARRFERPNGIEELTDLREYIKTVPDSLFALQAKMDRALADWELLTDFNCGLSDDDANVRWSMVAWPRKLQQQMAATFEQVALDETKFRDNLTADLTAFDQQLRSLQMTVAGFSQFDNMSRVEAIAVDVRKISGALKDAAANAITFVQHVVFLCCFETRDMTPWNSQTPPASQVQHAAAAVWHAGDRVRCADQVHARL